MKISIKILEKRKVKQYYHGREYVSHEIKSTPITILNFVNTKEKIK